MKFFFATTILLASIQGAAVADDSADAKALLDAVIKANGGEESLGKIVGEKYTNKGTAYSKDEKTPLKQEAFFQCDDKMRLSSSYGDAATPDIEVVNGKKGWSKDAGKEAEVMGDQELASERETMYLTWALNFVPLKGKDYQLSLLDEIDVDGRKAVGLLVRHDKHEPGKLYFDKESHLLIKYQRSIKDPDTGKTVVEEAVCSDYTDVQGTKQPRKQVTFWDGVKIADVEVETKLYDKPLDEKLFVKP